MERSQVRNYLGSNQGAPVRVDRRRLTGQLNVKKWWRRRDCKELLGFKLDLWDRCQMSLTNRQCRERWWGGADDMSNFGYVEFEMSNWRLDSPVLSSGTSSRLEIWISTWVITKAIGFSLTGPVACRWFSYNPQQKYISFHSPVHMYIHIKIH